MACKLISLPLTLPAGLPGTGGQPQAEQRRGAGAGAWPGHPGAARKQCFCAVSLAGVLCCAWVVWGMRWAGNWRLDSLGPSIPEHKLSIFYHGLEPGSRP